MEYTQEQINKLKTDPIVQLLSAVTGTPIDVMVSNIKVKKKDSTKSINETEKSDIDNLYPLTKEDIIVIVQSIIDLHKAFFDLEKLGLDIWNSNLGDTVYNFIKVILNYAHEDLPWIYDEINWIEQDANTIVTQIINKITNE